MKGTVSFTFNCIHISQTERILSSDVHFVIRTRVKYSGPCHYWLPVKRTVIFTQHQVRALHISTYSGLCIPLWSASQIHSQHLFQHPTGPLFDALHTGKKKVWKNTFLCQVSSPKYQASKLWHLFSSIIKHVWVSRVMRHAWKGRSSTLFLLFNVLWLFDIKMSVERQKCVEYVSSQISVDTLPAVSRRMGCILCGSIDSCAGNLIHVQNLFF